jgi:hypothetical protein
VRAKRILVLGVVVAALGAASVAQAQGAQFWHDARADALGTQIAGFQVTVAQEDDDAEWAQILCSLGQCDGGENVLGFTTIAVPPEHPWYHVLFLSRMTSLGLEELLQGRQDDLWGETIGAFALIHEAYHQRLSSGDEGRVNACALRDFPYWLEYAFGVPQTVTTTMTTYETVAHTTTTTGYVWKWRRVHEKRQRVRVKVTVKTTRYVQVPQTTTATAPNPTFQTMIANAQSFYSQQPAPYNTGTCS